MLVYRVQNDEGVGPYRVCRAEALISSCRGQLNEDIRPHPRNDRGIGAKIWDTYRERWEGRGRFGFASIDQLKAWFDTKKIRNGLDKLGLKVYVIEVNPDHCLIGETQVVFIPEPAPGQDFEPDSWSSNITKFQIHGETIRRVISLRDI